MKLQKKSNSKKQSINKIAEYFLEKKVRVTRKDAFRRAKEANKFKFV